MKKTKTPSTSRRRTSKGSALVEMAIIYMVFALMLVGAFDFGQFLFVHQALVERARYAGRWGAINDPTNTASISNMVRYYQVADPPPGTPSYFNLTAGNVVVTNPGSGTNQYRLNIKISGYKFVALSPYIGGNITGPAVTVDVPLGLYN
jgi:Flp pilus assembly protein TadG